MIETFMFSDLEVTFTAALSLLLFDTVFPGIIDASFLTKAKDVLQDMGNSGNIPARTLAVELDNISQLLVDFPTSQGRSIPTQLSLRMGQDGEALNNALRDIVEIELVLEGPNLDLQTLPLHVPQSYDGNLQVLATSPENVVIPSMDRIPSAPLGANSITQLDELFLGNFDTFGTEFDTDMTNSEWLDFM
jgi:hypothetical protein